MDARFDDIIRLDRRWYWRVRIRSWLTPSDRALAALAILGGRTCPVSQKP